MARRACLCLVVNWLTILVNLKYLYGKLSSHSSTTSLEPGKQCNWTVLLPGEIGLRISRHIMNASTSVVSLLIHLRCRVRTLDGSKPANKSLSCLFHKSGEMVWSSPTSPRPLTAGSWTKLFTFHLSSGVKMTFG